MDLTPSQYFEPLYPSARPEAVWSFSLFSFPHWFNILWIMHSVRYSDFIFLTGWNHCFSFPTFHYISDVSNILFSCHYCSLPFLRMILVTRKGTESDQEKHDLLMSLRKSTGQNNFSEACGSRRCVSAFSLGYNLVKMYSCL